MKAIDRPFTKIINGTTQFVIPVFQRDHSWTETQCEQLRKDVVKVAGLRGRDEHLFDWISVDHEVRARRPRRSRCSPLNPSP